TGDLTSRFDASAVSYFCAPTQRSPPGCALVTTRKAVHATTRTLLVETVGSRCGKRRRRDQPVVVRLRKQGDRIGLGKRRVVRGYLGIDHQSGCAELALGHHGDL